MSFRSAFSIHFFAVALLTGGPAHAGSQDVGASFDELSDGSTLSDVDTVSDNDVVSEEGKLFDSIEGSFNKSDSSTDDSSYTSNSYNTSGSYNVTGNILAIPVAKAYLAGYVSENSATASSDASDASCASTHANASVELGDGALASFTGVNSLNLNAAANALQQTNVSISAASIAP